MKMRIRTKIYSAGFWWHVTDRRFISLFEKMLCCDDFLYKETNVFWGRVVELSIKMSTSCSCQSLHYYWLNRRRCCNKLSSFNMDCGKRRWRLHVTSTNGVRVIRVYDLWPKNMRFEASLVLTRAKWMIKRSLSIFTNKNYCYKRDPSAVKWCQPLASTMDISYRKYSIKLKNFNFSNNRQAYSSKRMRSVRPTEF